MPLDAPTDSQSYWKRQARDFFGYYGRQGFSARRSVSAFLDARTTVLWSLAGWDRQSRMLDLGCGSGVHMATVAGQCRSVIGLDYSAQMLASAAEQLAGQAASNACLALGDAQALPFARAHFDWIVSMGLLDYVDSPAAVLAECRRVLCPQGRAIVSLPKSPSAFFWLRTPWGDRLKARVFGLPPVRNVLSRGQVESLFSAAGFEIESLSAVWTTMWMVKARVR